MSRHAKGVLAGGAIVVVTGAIAFVILSSRDQGRPAVIEPARAPGGFLMPAPEAPPAQPSDEQQVATMMQAWRDAIVGRDAETVLTCDRTFVAEPRLFTPALVKSAESDPDPRVRAFSTRVLGKFVDPTLIETFRKRLADADPYVRENAAWSLGELQQRASGTAGDLEQLRRRDKEERVRQAAAEALPKLRRPAMANGRGD